MSGVSDFGWKLVAKAILLWRTGRAGPIFVEPDTVPPPSGYDSWSAYIEAKGLTDMDYLPLGAPAPEARKMTAVWTRTGEDVAVCNLHFVAANPGIDGDSIPFTDAMSAAIESRFITLWTALRVLYGAEIGLDRFEWHSVGVDISTPNPKVRETLLTPIMGTGDAADQLPPQVAVSVTFKTDHRKTWGRLYLPAPMVGSVDTGRILADDVATTRTLFGTFLDGVAGDDTPAVVWSPRHDGNLLQFTSTKPKPSGYVLDIPDTTSFAKSINQVQVDDLFDVIRSRRFDRATVKDTHTVGA